MIAGERMTHADGRRGGWVNEETSSTFNQK